VPRGIRRLVERAHERGIEVEGGQGELGCAREILRLLRDARLDEQQLGVTRMAGEEVRRAARRLDQVG
jgi:hypothetical protein